MKVINDMIELERTIKNDEKMIIFKEGDKIMIMTIEEYNRIMLADEIERNLLEAEYDIENGEVYDAEEVFKEWDEQYGV